jgi:hypothetical protein
MTFYRILLTIDLIAGAVVLFFFFWSLADGSFAYSPDLWLALVAFVCGTIAGGMALQRRGRLGWAIVLLLPVGWVAFFYGLFILAAMFAGPGAFR